MIKTNNNGSAFIIVILTMAVILILATTIASVSAGNFAMGHATRRYESAFYVAEAGIRHQVEHMRTRMENINRVNPPTTATAFFAAFQNPSPPLAAPRLNMHALGSDNGWADIVSTSTTGSGDTRTYHFTSTGRVGSAARNVSRTLVFSVTIQWSLSQPPPLLFQHAIYSSTHLAFGGNPDIYNGTVATGDTDVPGANRPDFHNIPQAQRRVLTGVIIPMPPVIIPNLPLVQSSDLTISGTMNTNTSGRYGNVTINDTWRFDLSQGDLFIQVENLQFNTGRIETVGNTGRLYLFVNGDVDLTGNDRINQLNPPRPDRVVMFVTGNLTIVDVRGNAIIHAYIYASSARIELNGTQDFTGAIMALDADVRGNANITFVPFAAQNEVVGDVLFRTFPILTVNPWREQQ